MVSSFFWKLNAHKNVLACNSKKRINEPPGSAKLTVILPVDLLGFSVGLRLTRGALHACPQSCPVPVFILHLRQLYSPFSFHSSLRCEWDENVFSFYLPGGKTRFFSLSPLREAWHSYEWYVSSVSFIKLAWPECHHGFFMDLFLVKIFYFKICVFCGFIFIVQGN